MPVLSGLELAKLIYERYPAMRTILLSGFEDFAHAQKALEYKVFAYLTKPVDNRKILTAVLNASQEIAAESDAFRQQARRSGSLAHLTDKDAHYASVAALCAKMNLALSDYRFDQCQALLSQCFQFISENEPLLSPQRRYVFHMLSELHDHAVFLDGKLISFLKEQGLDSLTLTGQLQAAETLAELKVLADAFSQTVLSYYTASTANNTEILIRRALAFIRSQYSDPKLTLLKVANAIGVNYSYLSTLFKKETGVGFSEHLNTARMNRAGELAAKTLLKGYEIADKVGFTNPYYFGQCFKKQFGLSVSEYRAQQKTRKTEPG